MMSVETIESNDSVENNVELQELKERARKLSEQLKILNASEESSEVSSMIELNEENPPSIEVDRNDNDDIIESLDRAPNIVVDGVDEMEKKTGKERSFVKLLNKTDLGNSLEHVNNILVGIEKDLSSKALENNEKDSILADDVESSDESTEKTWKPHRPKKTISFCLPDLEPNLAEPEPSPDTPSEDKAVIDDGSTSTGENCFDFQERQLADEEVEPQQKERIENKAVQIEKCLGKISKQKYFSDKDEKDKVGDPSGEKKTNEKEVAKTGWPTFEQKQVYTYPDYTTIYKYP